MYVRFRISSMRLKYHFFACFFVLLISILLQYQRQYIQIYCICVLMIYNDTINCGTFSRSNSQGKTTIGRHYLTPSMHYFLIPTTPYVQVYMEFYRLHEVPHTHHLYSNTGLWFCWARPIQWIYLNKIAVHSKLLVGKT